MPALVQDPGAEAAPGLHETAQQKAFDICRRAPQVRAPYGHDDPLLLLEEREALVVALGLFGGAVPLPPLELAAEAHRLVPDIEMQYTSAGHDHGDLRMWCR